jgi:hypothetical protein
LQFDETPANSQWLELPSWGKKPPMAEWLLSEALQMEQMSGVLREKPEKSQVRPMKTPWLWMSHR